MKTVLITGSSGFLGKNLASGLATEYNLLLPTHHQLDLLDKAQVEKYFVNNKVEVVIHTAALGIVRGQNADPSAIQKNLDMFLNVASQSDKFGNMIFCGSGAVYDKRQSLNMVKEEEFGKSVPVDAYGVYKYKCSEYIEKSENILDLRLFGIYGPYEDYATRFISNAICRSLLNIPITIIQDVKFDYLYINDFIKVVKHFIEHPAKHKSYNVGTGQPVSILQIAQRVKQLFNNNLEIVIKSEGLNNEYTCDTSRLLGELPNFKFTALDESLKELYNWYKERLNEIDANKLQFDK